MRTRTGEIVGTTKALKSERELHPCDPPRWWERRKRGIHIGDIWRCGVCGQEYELEVWLEGDLTWRLLSNKESA